MSTQRRLVTLAGLGPRVSADRVLLRQLVDNLVGNVLTYVAPGQQPGIDIRGTASGGGVVLEVRLPGAAR